MSDFGKGQVIIKPSWVIYKNMGPQTAKRTDFLISNLYFLLSVPICVICGLRSKETAMLETIYAQLRFAASVVFGFPFNQHSLDR